MEETAPEGGYAVRLTEEWTTQGIRRFDGGTRVFTRPGRKAWSNEMKTAFSLLNRQAAKFYQVRVADLKPRRIWFLDGF